MCWKSMLGGEPYLSACRSQRGEEKVWSRKEAESEVLTFQCIFACSDSLLVLKSIGSICFGRRIGYWGSKARIFPAAGTGFEKWEILHSWDPGTSNTEGYMVSAVILWLFPTPQTHNIPVVVLLECYFFPGQPLQHLRLLCSVVNYSGGSRPSFFSMLMCTLTCVQGFGLLPRLA